ncbi:MAG: hypothetical protein KAR20_15620, partial [Candidatus Heimdallarchaeota archaeon]|nr:hypothetical protein [Candidatus Heimdallarchaeota archaeon]
PLADDSWFLINSKAAAASALPLDVGYVFKTPDGGNAITPAVDDDVYPITKEKICKVDANVAATKGTLDVTDDCSYGYNEMIPDGYTDLSGDFTGFLKFNVPGGGIAIGQRGILNRYFDFVDDDGAGVYVLTPKNDDDFLLAILQNSDQISVGDVQSWLLIPAILSGATLGKALKGVQNLDSSWAKAQGPASIYERVTNATETVF